MAQLNRRTFLLYAGLLPLPAFGQPAGPDAAALPPLEQPEGEILLTVSGDIPLRNSPEGAVFDRAMLQALGEQEFTTSTPWSQFPMRFRGPSLQALNRRLGITEGIFTARAFNDYNIPVPVSEGVEGGPILALSVDDEELTLRQRGPVWLIYPFDQQAAYRGEVSYSRSIWQLSRLEWRPELTAESSAP